MQPSLVKDFAEPGDDWNYAPPVGGINASTTAVTIKAAVTNKRNYLSSIQISSSGLANATELAVRDGAGGTVLWRGTLGTAAFAPVAIEFPSPLKATMSTLLEIATLTSAVGNVLVNAQGYVAD